MKVERPEDFARLIAQAMVEDLHETDPDGEGTRSLIARTQNPARTLADLMIKDIERAVRKNPGPVLFPRLRRVVLENVDMRSAMARAGSGLGQFDWSAVISGVIGGATTYLAKQLEIDAQKSIAKMQIQAAQQQQAQVAAQAAQQQAGSQLQLTQAAAGAPIPSAPGLPGWLLPAAGITIGALGLWYIASQRRSGGRRYN